MFPGSSKGGGMCMAFPDVCKVPAPPAPFVPVPFPNMGQISGAKSTSSKVKFVNKPACTKASYVSSTQGDQPGTLKGMISMTTGGKAAYKQGSGKVKIQGKPAVTMLKVTAHNGSNANAPPGAQIAPSQVKVLIG